MNYEFLKIFSILGNVFIIIALIYVYRRDKVYEEKVRAFMGFAEEFRDKATKALMSMEDANASIHRKKTKGPDIKFVEITEDEEIKKFFNALTGQVHKEVVQQSKNYFDKILDDPLLEPKDIDLDSLIDFLDQRKEDDLEPFEFMLWKQQRNEWLKFMQGYLNNRRKK